MNLKTLAQNTDRWSPDLGVVHYLVDGNYRTQAQGWTRGDHTGPLDLWLEHNVGYVFGSGGGAGAGSGGGLDYATDAAAVQAANDAMIDFRGDIMFFTPGAYSLAAAVTVDVPDARWLGQRVSSPIRASATITAAIAAAISPAAAADRMEFGYLKFVPLTAATVISNTAGCNQLHMHDFFYDTRGITGSTSTILLTASTAADHQFNDFVIATDASQGAPFTYTGTATLVSFKRYTLWHSGGVALAIALADFQGAATGVEIETGRGNLTGLASTAVTNLVKFSESGGDVQTISMRDLRHSIGFCASNALLSLNGAEVGEVGIAAAYLDVVSAGAGGAGTAFTA